MANLPSRSVVTPVVVPLTTTLAEMSASLVLESVIVPFTVCCASKLKVQTRKNVVRSRSLIIRWGVGRESGLAEVEHFLD